MYRILIMILFSFLFIGVRAQNVNKDSILINSKCCYKKKKSITITLENHTGMDLQRAYPMSPLSIFKWVGDEWVQVAQVGYCACGTVFCPPPLELMPFYNNDKIALSWDQMETRCVDKEKGIVANKWSGKGKYMVVFEFKIERDSASFQRSQNFRIR